MDEIENGQYSCVVEVKNMNKKKPMKRRYTIHLMPHKDGYTVTVPDIPGCITEGKSVKEAVDMARDAISMLLIDMEDACVAAATREEQRSALREE